MDNRQNIHGLTKVFFGLIYGQKSHYKEIMNRIRQFATPDMESREIPFDFTDYYNDEMGSPLFRKWVSVELTISENELVDLKHRAIKWENELSINNKRTVNCDPGGISEKRVILVTTKDYTHRLYMGNGIYGEITLIYRGGKFNPLEWTYPDYRADCFLKFAHQCRKKFRESK